MASAESQRGNAHFTHQPPQFWEVDNTNMGTGGQEEFRGWCVLTCVVAMCLACAPSAVLGLMLVIRSFMRAQEWVFANPNQQREDFGWASSHSLVFHL
jgi:hypothetical protein